jgi:hypothetical protein
MSGVAACTKAQLRWGEEDKGEGRGSNEGRSRAKISVGKLPDMRGYLCGRRKMGVVR